ncbi:hypothetical protein AB0L97_20510 [Nocardia sp. NPDC051911]|uniref:hypothetical protein n=1 Tax=Nocardia sp. NPDC051911 TaxID=3154648 RepID=UPI003434ED34
MTDSPQLPSVDAVRKDLVIVRKKGVHAIGQVDVRALRRCVAATGLGEPKATAKDLENLVRSGIEGIENDNERDALNLLFGVRAEVRGKLLGIRREKAARALHMTSEGFRKHRESSLISKLAASVCKHCAELLDDATASKSANFGNKRNGNGDSSWRVLHSWTLWLRTLNNQFDHVLHRLTKSPKWIALAALLGALAAISTIIVVFRNDSTPTQGAATQVTTSPTPMQTNVIYVAGTRFINYPFQKTSEEVYCGNSPASNRSDAYLCLVPGTDGRTRMKLDPCFAVEQGAVACPSLGLEKTYSKWHAPAVKAPQIHPVPAGYVTTPYEVVLSDGMPCLSITGLLKSLSDNSQEMIFAANIETPSNPIYRCNLPPSPVVAVNWTFAEDGLLATAKWIEDPAYYQSQIGGLSKENGTFYGLYSPAEGQSFQRVSIAAVVS